MTGRSVQLFERTARERLRTMLQRTKNSDAAGRTTRIARAVSSRRAGRSSPSVRPTPRGGSRVVGLQTVY